MDTDSAARFMHQRELADWRVPYKALQIILTFNFVSDLQ